MQAFPSMSPSIFIILEFITLPRVMSEIDIGVGVGAVFPGVLSEIEIVVGDGVVFPRVLSEIDIGVDVGIGVTLPRVRSEIDLVVGVGVGGRVDDGTGVEVAWAIFAA